MAALKIVLDTNALLRSISRKSKYAVVIDKLYSGAYELYVSTEILLEYEEIITEFFSEETAELTVGAFTLLENVKKTEIHFHFNLISSDEDDNKFSDCAFAANAHYLVTNDNHYNKLKTIPFPHINVITLEEFVLLLKE